MIDDIAAASTASAFGVAPAAGAFGGGGGGGLQAFGSTPAAPALGFGGHLLGRQPEFFPPPRGGSFEHVCFRLE